MRITALVPAYNEEKHIFNVLDSVSKSPMLDEIICINDGSTDHTFDQIRKAKGISVINLKKNHGKGYAIAQGILKSTGDIILFIDADIQYLKNKHISQLLEPLISQKYDISIGYPTSDKRNIVKKFDFVMRYISGERAYFKKDLIPLVREIKKKGYGLEIFLNYSLRQRKTVTFPLEGVKHYWKHQKQSIDTVAKLQVVEGFDLFLELINQSQTIPLSVKDYFSKVYISESPQIQKKINTILKKVKKTLINSF